MSKNGITVAAVLRKTANGGELYPQESPVTREAQRLADGGADLNSPESQASMAEAAQRSTPTQRWAGTGPGNWTGTAGRTKYGKARFGAWVPMTAGDQN